MCLEIKPHVMLDVNNNHLLKYSISVRSQVIFFAHNTYSYISNETVYRINQYLIIYLYVYVTMIIWQKFSFLFFIDTRKGGLNKPLLDIL